MSLREFLISKKLGKYANFLGKNARVYSTETIKLIKEATPLVKSSASLLSVVTSGFRVFSKLAEDVSSNPESEKAFFTFIEETWSALSKRIKALASLIAQVSKNPSVKLAYEAFEKEYQVFMAEMVEPWSAKAKENSEGKGSPEQTTHKQEGPQTDDVTEDEEPEDGEPEVVLSEATEKVIASTVARIFDK